MIFTKEEMINYCKGNPGALTMLLEVNSDIIVTKIKKLKDLRGTNLYILYSDLCNKEMDKVEDLCKNCPDAILSDACSRQDYSGRELVKKYFKEQ